MELWEWVLWSFLVMLYVSCLVSLAVVTFRKGRYVLGGLGVIFPFLWLIGALLPAKPNSNWDEMAQRTAALEAVTKDP